MLCVFRRNLNKYILPMLERAESFKKKILIFYFFSFLFYQKVYNYCTNCRSWWLFLRTSRQVKLLSTAGTCTEIQNNWFASWDSRLGRENAWDCLFLQLLMAWGHHNYKYSWSLLKYYIILLYHLCPSFYIFCYKNAMMWITAAPSQLTPHFFHFFPFSSFSFWKAHKK